LTVHTHRYGHRLAKDIDFLQSEKIGDQQKIDTTRNLMTYFERIASL